MSVSIEQAVMQIKHDVSKAFDAATIVALLPIDRALVANQTV